MNVLKQYVDQQNAWLKIFGQEPFDYSTPEGRKELAAKIDCDLSPENLTCDGEASPSAVRQKRQLLLGAAHELKQMDPSLEFFEI